MQLKGLDRVVIGVRDMDAALSFFADKLGIKLSEIDAPLLRTMGERAAISMDYQIEVVSPLEPLPETAPPFVLELKQNLERNQVLILGLAFKVDDAGKAQEQASALGLGNLGIISTQEFNQVMGINGLRELILDPQDTLGMMLAFAEYQKIG